MIIQLTGLDFILNNFEPLDDSFNLIDDYDALRGILIEEGLFNMIYLFEEGTMAPTTLPNIVNQDGNGRSLRSNDHKVFVEDFLKVNFDVEIEGDFDTFVSEFGDSADFDKVFTVFAPSNKAMADLNFQVPYYINMSEILNYIGRVHIHVGKDELEYDDLKCDKRIKMSNGLRTTTKCRGNRVISKFQVGNFNLAGSRISRTMKDNQASNGVIQVLTDVVIIAFSSEQSDLGIFPSLVGALIP